MNDPQISIFPNLEDLPELLRHISERLGMDAAKRVAVTIGGREINIPVKAEGSKLASLVGDDIAEVLCEEYRGIKATIPTDASFAMAERRYAILSQPDVPISELATKLGVSGRHIRRVRAKFRRARFTAQNPSKAR